jgi:hypothetical protein
MRPRDREANRWSKDTRSVLDVLVELPPSASSSVAAYTFEWSGIGRAYARRRDDAWVGRWRYDTPQEALEVLVTEGLWPWEATGEHAARWVCGRCNGAFATCTACTSTGFTTTPRSWMELVTLACYGRRELLATEHEWASVAPANCGSPVWTVKSRQDLKNRQLEYLSSGHFTWAKIHAAVFWWAQHPGVVELPERCPVVWDPPGGPSLAEETAAYRAIRALWRRDLYLEEVRTPRPEVFEFPPRGEILWGLRAPGVLAMPEIQRWVAR